MCQLGIADRNLSLELTMMLPRTEQTDERSDLDAIRRRRERRADQQRLA
jgi:hypothetical protein